MFVFVVVQAFFLLEKAPEIGDSFVHVPLIFPLALSATLTQHLDSLIVAVNRE